MMTGTTLAAIFLASLGLSLFFVTEIRYRLHRNQLQRRRDATYAAHKDIYRQSVSASPF